mgnify:CR=1 FL=1
MLKNTPPLEIDLGRIVIGSSLEAVLCAFYNKLKLIYTTRIAPDPYDTMEEYGLGTNKLDAWNKHVFQLSMASYVPFGDKVRHIRYVDENTIKVITKEENVYTVKYKKLYVFDDDNFLDLPPSLSKTSEELRVLDWFRVEGGDKSKIDNRFTGSKFLNQIIYNPDSDTEICAISYMKEKELDVYPEHLARIKSEKRLSTKINTVTLEHIRRDIFPLGKEVYEDFDNVIFFYIDARSIYRVRRKRAKIDYMKYLRKTLGIANDKEE